MSELPPTSISEHFATLSDPRRDHLKEHRLLDIVTIALCAVICGADDWSAMPQALANLAAAYAPQQLGDFVRDIGTLFAGLAMRFDADLTTAVTGVRSIEPMDVAQPSIHPWAYSRHGGMDAKFQDGDGDGNVHHWAWSFVLGYGYGEKAAKAINSGREAGMALPRSLAQRRLIPASPQDIAIGNAGAAMGAALRHGTPPAAIPNMLHDLLGIPR